jgi:hypothetical protein
VTTDTLDGVLTPWIVADPLPLAPVAGAAAVDAPPPPQAAQAAVRVNRSMSGPPRTGFVERGGATACRRTQRVQRQVSVASTAREAA